MPRDAFPGYDDPVNIDGEPDVNIVGGWACDACDVFVPQWDVDDDEL